MLKLKRMLRRRPTRRERAMAERLLRAERQVEYARALTQTAAAIMRPLGRGMGVVMVDDGEQARNWLLAARAAGLLSGPDGTYRTPPLVAERQTS